MRSPSTQPGRRVESPSDRDERHEAFSPLVRGQASSGSTDASPQDPRCKPKLSTNAVTESKANRAVVKRWEAKRGEGVSPKYATVSVRVELLQRVWRHGAANHRMRFYRLLQAADRRKPVGKDEGEDEGIMGQQSTRVKWTNRLTQGRGTATGDGRPGREAQTAEGANERVPGG
ncbi:hypothetical protein MMC28_007012 [Mycoblastus sanguinarius]|nr:hypothetical protein [Mycoblastus sanguinarius]